jgi:hypothetical protein
VYIPFLNTAFQTRPLGGQEWLYVAPLLLVPSIAAEAAKYIVTARAEKKGA